MPDWRDMGRAALGRVAIGVLHAMARLPWPVLHGLGRGLGALLYRIDGREARTVRANLEIVWPDLPVAERERRVRHTLIETAITFCEMPRIWLGRSDVASRVDPGDLPERMRALVAGGRGLILAMPHHGNWELVSAGIAPELPITGLYRPPRLSFLESFMTRGRSVARIRMVPTSAGGIKALNRALRAGEVIAILPDQVPKNAGAAATVAPFFGRRCTTMTLLGRLAARHGAPVLFVWAERQPDGRYRMRHFLADEAIADPDPLRAATALNRCVARCIEDRPEQYQWAYRRFYPALPGQSNPYAGAGGRRPRRSSVSTSG